MSKNLDKLETLVDSVSQSPNAIKRLCLEDTLPFLIDSFEDQARAVIPLLLQITNQHELGLSDLELFDACFIEKLIKMIQNCHDLEDPETSPLHLYISLYCQYNRKPGINRILDVTIANPSLGKNGGLF